METDITQEINDSDDKKRKKGGQPGNRNALKHGIYSHFIAVRDNLDMEGMSNNDHAEELALARVRLKSSIKQYNKAAEKGDKKAMIAWENTIRKYLETITTIKSRFNEEQETEECVWTTIMEALRATNDREEARH
jgi:hypothetical protein